MSQFMKEWNARTGRTVSMILAALMVAGVSTVALESVIRRDTTRVGLSWILAGITLAGADLVYRSRATEPVGWTRFVSGMAGGGIRIYPMWLVGLGAIVLGVLYWARII